MTREEAIKVLEFFKGQAEKYDGSLEYINPEEVEAFRMAIKALEATAWIPVGERLPDIKEHHVSDPCLVYCENGAYGFAELEENIFGQVGWNCEREDEYHEPIGDILAWMPLPEPYREEDET